NERYLPAPAAGQVQQQKPRQIAERNAADIAEKDPRRRPAPRKKPDSSTDDAGCEQRRPWIGAIADEGEEQQPAADRRGFTYGEPIDPVHEIEQVNPPDPHKACRSEIKSRTQPSFES